MTAPPYRPVSCPRCGYGRDPGPWTACLRALREHPSSPEAMVERLVRHAHAAGFRLSADRERFESRPVWDDLP